MDINAKFHHLRFPHKMWTLLKLHPDAIFWSCSGKSVLLNYKILDDYLLSPNSIFKTSNLSSFIRQLNLYGFRKVTSHSQDPACNAKNPYLHEFMSDYFQFGKPELLNKIVRKSLSPRKRLKYQKVTYSSCGPQLQKARKAFRLALKRAAEEIYQTNQQVDPADIVIDVDECFEVDTSKDSGIVIEKKSETSISQEYDDDLMISNETRNHSFVTICETIPFNPDSPSQNHGNCVKNYFDVPIIDLGDVSEEKIIPICDLTDNNDDKSDILDCVLPSCSAEENVVTVEKSSFKTDMDRFSKEWDQMFKDISIENQNCSTEFKEFFCQIYKTMDLLNA